jgi:hypothetical protein
MFLLQLKVFCGYESDKNGTPSIRDDLRDFHLMIRGGKYI